MTVGIRTHLSSSHLLTRRLLLETHQADSIPRPPLTPYETPGRPTSATRRTRKGWVYKGGRRVGEERPRMG